MKSMRLLVSTFGIMVALVMLMALMGYIRSGLREDWHIFGVVRDVSAGAATPSMAYMARVIAGIVAAFMALIAFVFWLAGLGETGEVEEGIMIPVEAGPMPAPSQAAPEPAPAAAASSPASGGH